MEWFSTQRRKDAKTQRIVLVKASGGMVTLVFEHSHLP